MRVRALFSLPLHLGSHPHHLLLPDVAMPLCVGISQVNNAVPVNQPLYVRDKLEMLPTSTINGLATC